MYTLLITVHIAKFSCLFLLFIFKATVCINPKLLLFVDLKNKWHLVMDRLTVLFLKFLEYFHKLQLFIWWLLEIHIIKIISSYIILLSVTEVSTISFTVSISYKPFVISVFNAFKVFLPFVPFRSKCNNFKMT